MKTLYIDQKDMHLMVEANRLIIRSSSERLVNSIPIKIVEKVVISTGVMLSSTVINKLTKEGVTLVFINTRQVESSAITSSLMHNDVTRRIQQFKIIDSMKERVEITKKLVFYKIKSQRLILKRALKIRPDNRYILTKNINILDEILLKAVNENTTSVLRGYEGAAASAYFDAYKALFAESLSFNHRNRRPPKDPVNALLSLTYTLTHIECVRALFSEGFDPFMGFYHEPSYGRESLACDLVEMFRARVDLWVWRLFAEQVIRVDHFSLVKNGDEMACMLSKSGREIFYYEFSLFFKNMKKLIYRMARQWRYMANEIYLSL